MLWVGVALGMVIGFAVSTRLERYAARRGDSGYRVRKFAACCGVLLGAGFVALVSTWQSALLLFAAGGATTTLFLLWFRRPRVGPPRSR